MPYLAGLLTGIILTVLVIFVIDHVGDDPASADVVNWDYVGLQLGESAKDVGEEIRQEVHEATAPDAETPAPAPPATSEPARPSTPNAE